MYHFIEDHARALRKTMTLPEVILWQRLRRKQLGAKFRRQVAMGPYVVDFLCFDKKLAIEIDGGHHAVIKAYDDKRTQWLELRGFIVLRFWNSDVLHSLDTVLDTIQKILDS